MPMLASQYFDLHISEYIKNGTIPFHNYKWDLNNLKNNEVLFIKSDVLCNKHFVNTFIYEIENKIKKNIILVSGVSDLSVPQDLFNKIVNCKYILKWYTTNPIKDHEKVEFLPIGFAEKNRINGNEFTLYSAHKELFNTTKDDSIYISYHGNSNPYRNNIIKELSKYTNVIVEKNKLDFKDYLIELSKHKFSVCIEGNGIDVHKTYESLLVGSIPIIKKSGSISWFKKYGLLGITINNWKNFNSTEPDFFENYYENIKSYYNDEIYRINVMKSLSVYSYMDSILEYKSTL